MVYAQHCHLHAFWDWNHEPRQYRLTRTFPHTDRSREVAAFIPSAKGASLSSSTGRVTSEQVPSLLLGEWVVRPGYQTCYSTLNMEVRQRVQYSKRKRFKRGKKVGGNERPEFVVDSVTVEFFIQKSSQLSYHFPYRQ